MLCEKVNKAKKGSAATAKSLVHICLLKLLFSLSMFVHMRPKFFFSITWNGFCYAQIKKGLELYTRSLLGHILQLMFFMLHESKRLDLLWKRILFLRTFGEAHLRKKSFEKSYNELNWNSIFKRRKQEKMQFA